MQRAARVSLVLMLALCAAPACKSAQPHDPTAKLNVPKLLDHMADQVVLPLLQDFSAATGRLRDRTQAYAAAAASGPALDERMQAHASWRDAMELWQRAELLQFGPAGNAKLVKGGQGLREQIYSWPTNSPCRVDQELARGEFRTPGYLDGQLSNVYGLDALEYLLFRDDPGNACAPQINLNKDALWAALGPEVVLRRAQMAEVVAVRIADDAERLRKAWDPNQGNFAAQLKQAGQSGSAYPQRRDALTDLLVGLVYLDQRTKDLKLALPAGLSKECTSPCPEQRESVWANHSLANVRANLDGFGLLALGNPPGAPEGFGLDDLLLELGEEALVSELQHDLEAAREAAHIPAGSMAEALASEPASVVALHSAVKALTDKLKGPIVTKLALQLPMGAGGDID